MNNLGKSDKLIPVCRQGLPSGRSQNILYYNNIKNLKLNA